MQVLLNKQNPIVVETSAWWPGGLMTAMAFFTLPWKTARHVSIAPPALSLAEK